MMDRDEYAQGEQEAEPIDMLAAYFEAHEWPFEHVAEDEISAKYRGSWTEYEIRAIWREDDQVLQVIVMPDIRIVEGRKAEIYEAIALINEQLWLGHFETWSSNGTLLFRHGALLGAQGSLTLDQAQLLIESAIGRVRALLPGLPVRPVGRQVTDRRTRREPHRNPRRGVKRFREAGSREVEMPVQRPISSAMIRRSASGSSKPSVTRQKPVTEPCPACA